MYAPPMMVSAPLSGNRSVALQPPDARWNRDFFIAVA